ncbi:helix-turn-helix transcriptional regulator [Brevibacillus massiliensis]|uniref:helix-turn-helix transcriptional regulator n=1 Tax=Brevibacillus massiliensis TaxID=1118054 RepID=UPI0011C7E380|nr:helix-turn-helix transcriptional regulator [Brevibacillus massiliensis]
MKEEYMTPEEAAAILKLSKFTVYEMIKRGDLPAVKLGRSLRILRSELDNLARGKKSREGARDFSLEESAPFLPQELPHQIYFTGSHDLAVDLLTQHLSTRGITLFPAFSGSLKGLIDLFNGRTEMAGCHLLDVEEKEYNLPYITRLLPGEQVTVIHFVYRWQGFILPKGNPRMITSWSDFFSGEHRIANRQKGSGTRVLLDQKIREMGVSAAILPGYDHECVNHYATAAAVLKGEADVALGIESVARNLELDFFPIHQERYDLVLPTGLVQQERFQIMLHTLRDVPFRKAIVALGGYDISQMGEIIATYT